jgi:hypothetical protein
MRFLTVAEVRRLAVAIGPAYRALILLGAYGGLRIGEMAGLRRKRLDLAAGVVEVAEVVTEMHGHLYLGPPKTTAGRRRVGLPRVVVEALLAVGVDADPVALQAVGAGAVALVDGDADPGALEALGQAQAAGPGTDDDDVDRRGGHGLTLPVVVSARVGRLGRSWCCIGRCPSTITPQRGWRHRCQRPGALPTGQHPWLPASRNLGSAGWRARPSRSVPAARYRRGRQADELGQALLAPC